MDMREKIDAALEKRGLSRRAAAKLARMKASSLCAYLKGRKEIQTDTLARLMEAAGLNKGSSECGPAPHARRSRSRSKSNCP